MGMDVDGRAPVSKVGEYFRNSVWYWRPLWDYCHQIAPELIDDELHRAGHCNDGAGLNAKRSVALADKLQEEIRTGRCSIYANDRAARLEGIPDEDCPHCHGTGTRHDLGPSRPCNACEGKGHRRPYDTYYGFDVDNVQKFAAFLRDSGGFKIY